MEQRCRLPKCLSRGNYVLIWRSSKIFWSWCDYQLFSVGWVGVSQEKGIKRVTRKKKHSLYSPRACSRREQGAYSYLEKTVRQKPRVGEGASCKMEMESLSGEGQWFEGSHCDCRIDNRSGLGLGWRDRSQRKDEEGQVVHCRRTLQQLGETGC